MRFAKQQRPPCDRPIRTCVRNRTTNNIFAHHDPFEYRTTTSSNLCCRSNACAVNNRCNSTFRAPIRVNSLFYETRICRIYYTRAFFSLKYRCHVRGRLWEVDQILVTLVRRFTRSAVKRKGGPHAIAAVIASSHRY